MKKLLVLLAFFSTIQFSEMLAEDSCDMQSSEVLAEYGCEHMYEEEVARTFNQICYRLVVINNNCKTKVSNIVCITRECLTSEKSVVFHLPGLSYTCTVVVEGRDCDLPQSPGIPGQS